MEVNRLVAETLQLVPPLSDLPVSPVAGLEPLLTVEQLCAWTGYSRSSISKLRVRTDYPLPQLGTVAAPRFLPSEVLAWMRGEYIRATGIEGAR